VRSIGWIIQPRPVVEPHFASDGKRAPLLGVQYLSIVHNRVPVETNDDGLNESTILVDVLISSSTCIAIYKAP
jgi:hypothetical protein